MGELMRRVVAVAGVVWVLSPASGAQAQITFPVNDLQPALALTGIPTPLMVAVQQNPEPVLEASPRAQCGPGSKPLEGMQGRVPASAVDSPQAAQGWTCNTSLVGQYPGMAGGFRTWRYTDPAGHVCAFYDTSAQAPLTILSAAGGPSPGVAVLDMSDPANPKLTATLTDIVMVSPHESLVLNAKRGLLAADMGNAAVFPGLMSIYDVSQDCRHPQLQSTFLATRFGHEGGFSPDGKTFWIGGIDGLAAVDVTDPKHPQTIWQANEFVHGPNVSDDGNRVYLADPVTAGLTILDTSQVQARAANPSVNEISRLTWKTVSIPQNTAPMQIGGHPYLLEFDEFALRLGGGISPLNTVGGARIIDIADERHPRVVSNIRLEVNQPDAHAQAQGDPQSLPTALTTYAAHYCAIPREVDPEIVACSFINSGLRIFNIQDPLHPREVAYFIAPPTKASVPLSKPADLALSMPAFDPARRTVWYTDAITGFYAVHLDNDVWPADPVAPACKPRRSTLVRLGGRHAPIRSVRVTIDGKRATARRDRHGGLHVTLAGRTSGRYVVRVRARLTTGRVLSVTRRYAAGC
jgi:hypothetical protein